MRHQPPGAAGSVVVEERIDDLAQTVLALALGVRQEGLDHLPLRIRDVGLVGLSAHEPPI
jgi:hypothetical protein